MENKTAADLMIPVKEYPRVSEHDTILDAIKEMDKIQIKSAGRLALPRVVLVFDHSTELVGVIRRRDIFRGLEPGFLVKDTSSYKRKLFDIHIDPNLTEMSPMASVHSIHKNAGRRVKDIMLPVAQTVDVSDHVMKMISLMVEYNISMLPVTENTRVVGVVRSADVLHYIAHDILEIDANRNNV